MKCGSCGRAEMLLNELGTGFAQVLELRLKHVLSLLKSI